MRLLLDTHIVLWALVEPSRINDTAKEAILSTDSEVFVSTASWWEIAIKIGIGKLSADLHTLRDATQNSGFKELPVLGYHTEALLELKPLHKDPFDRLLVAQAISEPMRLLTTDGQLAPYTDLVWPM